MNNERSFIPCALSEAMEIDSSIFSLSGRTRSQRRIRLVEVLVQIQLLEVVFADCR